MKEYNVHFSFYSEIYGSFEEATIKVDAKDQFEARSKAWKLSEDNEDLKFASCIKLCGITWNASTLDLQDYYNAEASYDKYKIQQIENVEKPNAKIEQNDRKYEECERERYSHFGSLYTIAHIAEDLGKPLGMLPPAIFEELHYAREFAYMPDCDFDKSSAMLKQIERAEDWDNTAIFSIRELFKHGYGVADGHDLDFSAQFGKDGLYPVHADRSDYASQYVHRRTNEREYKSMATLPFFGEKDIIPNSHTLQYEWQTLVIKKEVLEPEKQTPVNSLWIPKQDSTENFDKSGDKPMAAENLFTGEVATWKHSDFIGVLRPEKNAKINFDAIKIELRAFNDKQKSEKLSNIADGKKKPSILADMREKEKKIEANNPPSSQKKKQVGKDEL